MSIPRSAQRWHRVDELFGAALELEGAARAQYLAQACGDDSELRAEVESMIEFAQASEHFLERPPASETTMVWSAPAPTTPTGRHAAIDNARFVPGDIVAERYRIVGLLGRGGMGEVYRADDLKLSQPVALKFLSESLSASGAALARFHREVSVARQISHRHVCRVYDIGEHGGLHFLSMEFVRGEELSSLLKRIGRLPLDKAVETARQLCSGLAAVHAAGVLHRDLKPANVMIDEHGDVRITDFGVAALSAGIKGEEAMIGTPAYMSPEQLAGGELTTRSDLYALGLVLYELFTGKRPFAATSMPDLLRVRMGETTPTNPSDVIPDLDPLVERVILRCLEKDPERRPPTALHVAAALPGGDPLAAALAAGETPSPQMVAAANKEGSLRPLAATMLLLGIVAAIVLQALSSQRMALYHLLPIEPAEILRARAAEIARDAGYAAHGDAVAGFERVHSVLQSVEASDAGPDRWKRLRTQPLPAVQFWYRQSDVPLQPPGSWGVDMDDPPNTTPGMVRLRLDSLGRLLYFEGVPPRNDPSTATAAPNWTDFFARAGLAPGAFHDATPHRTPPHHSDARFAWTGTHPQRPGIPLRIEAASYRGLPVYFEIFWPWSEPDARSASTSRFMVVLLVFYFGAIALASLLAWRNLRLGRGDRRGTWRLMLFVFACRLVYWMFAVHHIPTSGEVDLVIRGLQAAVYWAALLGLLYLALEPFVRRRWPENLISWSRLLSGDVRDPLVGRDVLIGALCGLTGGLATQLHRSVPALLGLPSPPPSFESPLLYTHGFDGAHGFFPLLMNQASASILFPLVIHAILLFIAMIVRRNRIAAILTWLLFYFALYLNYGDGTLPSYIIGLILPTLIVLVLTRLGLLALVSMFFFLHLSSFYPATDPRTWFATTYLMQLITLGAITVFAYRVSLAGQKLLGDRFFE